MRKLLLTLMILVASFQLTAQNFLQDWTAYEKYCSELVPDTITISGTIVQRAVPITDEAGKIISYAMVPCGDTTWNKYECDEFKNESSIIWGRGWGRITLDTMYYNDYYNLIGYNTQSSCNEVTKKVICQIKREQPYFDGFIIWLKLPKQ